MLIYIINDENSGAQNSKLLRGLNKTLQSEVIKESKSFGEALQSAFTNNVDEALFIRDDSVIITNPETFQHLLDNISRSKKDIVYLSSWGDKCHISRPVVDVTLNDNFTMYTTHHPRGTQAIYLTRNGIYKIMQYSDSIDDRVTNAIYSGHLDVYSIFPQPVTLDINKITHNDQYQELNPCIPLKVGVREINDPINYNKTSYTGYIVIIIVLIILLIIMLRAYHKR
jgi:hypothetical protein